MDEGVDFHAFIFTWRNTKMAKFEFKTVKAELEFGDALKYEIPLSQSRMKDFEENAQKLAQFCADVRENKISGVTIEDLADKVLDAIDEIVGIADAADQIMALKPDYDFFDCLDVYEYINKEIADAWKSHTAPRTTPNVAHLNRAQRRAARQ